MRGLLGLIVVAAVLAVTALRSGAPLQDPLWWFNNTSPPHVSVQGPSGPLRGETQASIVLQPSDRASVVSITVDGRPTTIQSGRLTLDTSSLPDGQHVVTVLARDSSRRGNEASASWMFSSDNTPPELETRLEPSEGPQEGHTFSIRIRPSEHLQHLEGTFGGHSLRLQPDGSGGYWALEGVSPGDTRSSLALTLSASDDVGNTSSTSRDLAVRRTTFPEDDLDLDPSTVDTRLRQDENAMLNQVYQQTDGPRRWEGPFRLPVQGEISTEFGTHRSYEYHPGTDLAASMGSPVSAPAAGVVVFAGGTPARGNVLVISHGAGVFTTYAHLQTFEVEQGAHVSPGQIIGRVGTTGFSTGPHLHWELWVDGANVDPLEWTRRAFP